MTASSSELRVRLEQLALALWLDGASFFDIVDTLIETAEIVMAGDIDGIELHDAAELEDYETEGRRHAARLQGEIP